MCGICGIINSPFAPSETESVLRLMNNLVKHRGPDGEGYYFNEKVGLGHRRLSIIDLSQQGNQPFIYKTPSGKKLVIAHNGEIYNYFEIREELKRKGYSFRSQTDTEVILAAYDHWGKVCVRRFNGMWAFVIFDESINRLICSRDRYGIKPFYYIFTGNSFYFASEIKQFTALKAWIPKLNVTRAWEFLNNGYHDHTENTMFEGVCQLAPGSNMVLDTTTWSHSLEKYYEVGESGYPSKSNGTECDSGQFSKLFYNAVAIHLRSDVCVGTSLSGGIDSSSIVMAIHDILKGGKQKAISAIFPGYDRDESFYIDALAKNIDLSVSKISPAYEDVKNRLDQLIWHQDEPFSSASVFAQFAIYEEASKNGLKVMLDGQGADEILAGYEKFLKPYFSTILTRNALEASATAFWLLRKHNRSIEIIKSLLNRKWTLNRSIHITLPRFKPVEESRFQRSTDSTIRDCSINLIKEVGLPMLLRYQDRNSMAFSVESRVPFLDYRLVEYSLALPDICKIRQGVQKYLLKEAMKTKLPDSILNRIDKYAFDVPEALWIRKNVTWFLEQLKSALADLNGIINPHMLTWFDAFLKGKNQDFTPFWRIIVFHRWIKLFNIDISEC